MEKFQNDLVAGFFHEFRTFLRIFWVEVEYGSYKNLYP
jgi:hypothetical protein